MSRLSSVSRLLVTAETIARTEDGLRSYGEQGLEGLVLWVGVIEGETATVRDAWVPPQNPIRSEDGVGYLVTGETLFTLNRLLAEHRVRVNPHQAPFDLVAAAR